MRLVLAVSLLLVSALSSFAADIKLNFVRPSRLLAMLANGNPAGMTQVWHAVSDDPNQNLIPHGITRVRADDKAKILRVDGDPDAVEELQRYANLFDVRPRELKVTVDFEDPLDDHKARTETTIKNNKTWGMEDGVTGYRLNVAGRINDDNTVSLYIILRKGEKERNVVVRVKHGQPVEINPEMLLLKEPGEVKDMILQSGGKMIVGKGDASSQKITVRPLIQDERAR